MKGPERRERRIPALFSRVGDLAGNYFWQIASITGTIGGAAAILDVVFGIRLVPYGTALVDFLVSDGFTTFLLLILLISQILLYQRIEWIVGHLEERVEAEQEEDEEFDDAITDGGSDSLPPRDSEGRFTTKDSGGSNLLLLFLAGLAGYVIGNQTAVIDPIAAALIAIALVSLFQAMES